MGNGGEEVSGRGKRWAFRGCLHRGGLRVYPLAPRSSPKLWEMRDDPGPWGPAAGHLPLAQFRGLRGVGAREKRKKAGHWEALGMEPRAGWVARSSQYPPPPRLDSPLGEELP